MWSVRVGTAARWLSPASALRNARLRLCLGGNDVKPHANKTQIQLRPFTAPSATATAGTPAAIEGSNAANQPQKKQRSSKSTPASDASSKPAQQVQPVDYSTLLACAAELQHAWVPSKVEQVVMSDSHTLALRLRAPVSGVTWVKLSWHPTCARVSLNHAAPPRGAASEAYSFAETASTSLAGLVLVGVDVPRAWERVVALRFGPRPGEPPSRSLYCEIMARYSNVVLATGSDSIIACAYQVSGAMSSLRQLQTGKPYTFPPVTQGVPPNSTSNEDEWRSIVTQAAALVAAAHTKGSSKGGTAATVPQVDAADPSTAAQPPQPTSAAAASAGVAEGATRAFMGVSPSLMRDLCEAAGVAPATAANAMSDAQWTALHGQWRAWLARVESGAWTMCSDAGLKRYSVVGGLPLTHDSATALLETYYGEVQAGEVHTALHARLAGLVANSLKKARGRVYAFQQQLANASAADEVQKRGDLITANLYRIPPGAATVEAEDWDTGKPVVVELSPPDAPVQVAEGLYKKARKLRRAVDAVTPLLQAALEEVEYLEGLESDVADLAPRSSSSSSSTPAGSVCGSDGVGRSVSDVARGGGVADDVAALREVQEELVAGGYMRAPADAALAAKAAAKAAKASKRASGKSGGQKGAGQGGGTAAGFRQYKSPGGYQVLLGRSNVQNDALSTRVATDADLWLHVRGRPGSHAIIRVQPGQPTPSLGDADVQFAADLAAFFSKAKSDTKADVLVACASAVKKPKGAKPGQVFVTKELGNVVGRPSQSAAALAGESGGL